MKSRWLLLLGCGGAYLLLSLVMLWPLPRELGRAVPGTEFDIWQNTWNFWWVQQSLWEGQGSLLYTTMLYHPTGASLLFHTLSPANTVLALPVTLLWGPVAAYGVVALFSFVAAGLGGALLLAEVLRSFPNLSPAARRGAAFVGGALFTFSSYHHMQTLGHLQMLALQWFPFYVWALLRLWARPRPGRFFVAVLFLVLVAWTDWYYCLYALMLSGLFVLVQLLRSRFRGHADWRATLAVGAAIGAALAILAVQWVPMVREQARNPDVRLSPVYAIFYAADPLAYITPGPAHPLWGEWTQPLYNRYSRGNWAEGVLYQGLGALVLAVVGARQRWPGRGFWITTAIVFFVLSLGPVLQFAGEIITVQGQRILLPYGVLHLLPLMDIARVPARFGMLVTLAVAVLAGVGLAGLLQRYGRDERRRILWAGLVTLVLCAELTWVPYPLTAAHVPPFYHQLAQEPAGGALLELPIVRYPEEHTERLLYQTVHGHPTLGGYISRGDPRLPYAQIPGFRAFQALAVRREITEPTQASWQAQALAALDYYGAGYVVVQRPALSPGRRQAAEGLARALLGAPAYQDATTTAYRVPAAAGPFWEMGAGWGDWHWQEGPARLLQGPATLRLVLPEEATGQVCLRPTPAAGPAAVIVAVDGQAWGTVPGNAQSCMGPHTLPAGSHEVTFRPAAEGTAVWVREVWWAERGYSTGFSISFTATAGSTSVYMAFMTPGR